MRQLQLSKIPSPAVAAELAEALRGLQTLPAPPNLPPALAEAFAPAGLRFIVSVAAQYQEQGVSLVALAKAGFAAVTRGARTDNLLAIERGEWSCWVRQGMLEVIANQRSMA